MKFANNNLLRSLVSTAFIVFVIGNIVIVANTAKNYEFVNGNWFNGDTFEKKTFYSKNGVFSSKKPKKVDETLDLKNGFVIPPFADAHTHSLSVEKGLEKEVKKNLSEGVFYVQVLTNSQKAVVPIRKKMKNYPLEVLYANGGLTSTLGHPFFAFEPKAMGLKGAWWQFRDKLEEIKKSRLAENDGYWFFDSKEDVDAKWKKFIEGKPDVIKIYLLDAENQSKIPKNEKAGFKGLLPEVAKYIVKKAHKNGLQVYAHVETANDLRLGIKIGVDGFAHSPGYGPDWNDSPEAAKKYDPTKADFQKMADKEIVMIPTLSLSEQYSKKWKSDGTFELDLERSKKVLKRQRRLLKMMLDKGVNIALGSDSTNGNINSELFYINKNNLIDTSKLLNLATETTTQSMFPSRKIGKLKNGFEASFLVLHENPLENFKAIKNINMRFKQGIPIELKKEKSREQN